MSGTSIHYPLIASNSIKAFKKTREVIAGEVITNPSNNSFLLNKKQFEIFSLENNTTLLVRPNQSGCLSFDLFFYHIH